MTEERKDYAVLISLATREEAEVAAAALRADGIDAFLGNANHAGVEWFYVHAFGGVQIMVPRSKLEDAKTILQQRIREHASDHPEDRVGRRDRWKIWVSTLLMQPYVFVLLLAFASVNWLVTRRGRPSTV